jgi:hypothetical protein
MTWRFSWMEPVSFHGSEWPHSLQRVSINEANPHRTHFNPEDGGSMLFWNVDICLQDYTILQSRRRCSHRCDLFTFTLYDALSIVDYIASVGRMIDESERIWKEADVVWSRYSNICLEGMKKTTKMLSTRCCGRNSNRNLPNASL